MTLLEGNHVPVHTHTWCNITGTCLSIPSALGSTWHWDARASATTKQDGVQGLDFGLQRCMKPDATVTANDSTTCYDGCQVSQS